MSGDQDPRAVVRRAYELWSEDDLDGLLGLLDPSLEYRPIHYFPGFEDVYRGREGFRRMYEKFREPWASLTIDVHELLELGDRLLALFVFEATGREGLTVSMKMAHLGRVENGLVTELRLFSDWESAREAAGLPPEGSSGSQ